MTQAISTRQQEPTLPPGRNKSTVKATAKFGNFEASFEASISPMGLLAVGALVSAILLSVVPIIAASKRNRAAN